MEYSLVEYLKLAFDAKMYFLRSWRIAIQMRMVEYDNRGDLYPYIKDGKFVFDLNGETHTIKGLKKDKAILKWSDRITVPKGFIASIDKEVETTIGRLYLNTFGFVEEFGDLVPYINDVMTDKTFHKAYHKLYSEGKITSASQIRNSSKYLHILEADAEFGVPAASMETFTISDEVIKRKKELEKEYAGQLDDPVVQAKMDKELQAIDKESHKGTQAEDFLLSGKAYGVVRKKTKTMYGSETGMDGNPTPIVTKPLSEGLSIDDMPGWVNAARAGSYARGALTALGGFGVKQDDRAYGHLEIELGQDCGTKLGADIVVTDDNYEMFAGLRLHGSNEIAKVSDLRSKVGKVVKFRLPSHCALEKNYCEKCMGDVVKKGRYIIPGNVAVIDSNNMNAAMQAGHGKAKELRLITLDMLR